MTDPTGQTIGTYRVEALLGSGGMGQIYRASDQRDGRLVALKLLFPNLAANPKVRERFQQREARIAQSLRHLHIVEIYEAGEAGRRLYLAMELMPEGSLRDLLDRRSARPWPLALGLDLMRQAADDEQILSF